MGPSPPPKKKKPSNVPYLGATLGGLGAGSLGLAYGMSTDQHAQDVANAAARHGTPLEPNETALTRYTELLSPGANSQPWGYSIGDILSRARKHPDLLKRFGINADPATKPGSFVDAQMHYDQFRKGPIAAYYHMMHPNKMMNRPEYNVDGKSYPEYMKPHFDAAWRKFTDPETGYDKLRGNSRWLEPHEIDTSIIPFEAQQQFLRDYHANLSPEVRAIKEKAENDMAEGGTVQGLEKNLKSYLPVMRVALKARQGLKDVGMTSLGAGGGALAGNALYSMLTKKRNRTQTGKVLSSVAGAGLGGAGTYLGATEAGQERLNMAVNAVKKLLSGNGIAPATPGSD
jgi:hypothetical protein